MCPSPCSQTRLCESRSQNENPGCRQIFGAKTMLGTSFDGIARHTQEDYGLIEQTQSMAAG